MFISTKLVDKVTGNVINNNWLIDDSILPPQGVDYSKYMVLIPYIPYPEPDYDTRYFKLVINFPNLDGMLTAPAHPNYPTMKQYLITFSVEQRNQEDIFYSIDNAMKDANNSILPQDTQLNSFALSLAAQIKKTEGLALTQAEQDSINDLAAKGVKLRQNYDLAATKKALVIAGGQPDIDVGWERG